MGRRRGRRRCRLARRRVVARRITRAGVAVEDPSTRALTRALCDEIERGVTSRAGVDRALLAAAWNASEALFAMKSEDKARLEPWAAAPFVPL